MACPDRGSNPRPATLRTSALTITTPMQLVKTNSSKHHSIILYQSIMSNQEKILLYTNRYWKTSAWAWYKAFTVIERSRTIFLIYSSMMIFDKNKKEMHFYRTLFTTLLYNKYYDTGQLPYYSWEFLKTDKMYFA